MFYGSVLSVLFFCLFLCGMLNALPPLLVSMYIALGTMQILSLGVWGIEHVYIFCVILLFEGFALRYG